VGTIKSWYFYQHISTHEVPHIRRDHLASKLGDQERDRLVSLAQSDPPAGWMKWTLQRLAMELVEEGIVTRISTDQVKQALIEASNSQQPA
jgi:hypothetical protein